MSTLTCLAITFLLNQKVLPPCSFVFKETDLKKDSKKSKGEIFILEIFIIVCHIKGQDRSQDKIETAALNIHCMLKS